MITGKNYIGSAQRASGNVKFSSFNPANLEINPWEFTEATSEEIAEAVQKAAVAFESYRSIPGNRRADFLEKIAEEIEALGNPLYETYVRETALPEGRAKGETGRTTGQLRQFAALLREGSWVDASIDTAQPDRQPFPKSDIRKMLEANGPVVVFGASNFPMAFSTAGGDTASALAAGCPVIVKAHPMHPATSEWVAKAVLLAAKKTDMPDGVFSLIQGKGYAIGEQLVMHPLIKGVGFTGSYNGGMSLFKKAALREEPIPVFAEMGSVNPVVLLPDTLSRNAKVWAEKLSNSIVLGAGQFCTNPGLILGIENDAFKLFCKELGQKLADLSPQNMLGQSIKEGFDRGKLRMENMKQVTTLVNTEVPKKTNLAGQQLLKVSGDTFISNPSLQEEVFGPASLVIACKDQEQLNQALSGMHGQLTGSVIGDAQECDVFSETINKLKNKVGRLIFNGVPTGVEVCPSMHHGGPFPATTDSRYTSVGTDAILRWVRPVTYQDCPASLLPNALKDENPLGIFRRVNGAYSQNSIAS